MSKSSPTLIILIMFMLLLGFAQIPVQAATPLPASDWYAVTWVQSSDSLHWVNAQGEQGSIARPKLPNEAENPAVLRMRISPNGQHMVVIASLNSGNLGIGFYDLSAGQFVQMHEAQANEVLPAHSQLAFSFTGADFAMTLRNSVNGEWRVIVFDTASGNALDQLTRNSDILHETFITDPTWYPVIAAVRLDEAIGQPFVSLQTVTDNPAQLTFPSFKWFYNPVPALADQPVVTDSLPFSPFAGYDVRRITRAVVFTGFDEQGGTPANNVVGNFIGIHWAVHQLPIPVVNGAGYTLNSPQWLKTGEWIGYRIQNNVQQPHYAVSSAQSDTSVPLGPNIGAIHGTPDGFVAVNSLDWQLYHATEMNFDAFAYHFGNTVFQSDGQPFAVIYTTPEGIPFSLSSLPTTAEVAVPIGDNNQVQQPEQTCGTAPAPRLTVGKQARVTVIDNTDLNIRNAPAGDYVMQISEGTVVNVVNGPVCVDNYYWWQIQFESQGATVGGWGAEGDANEYYLEPFSVTLVDPLPLVPTSTPELIVVLPEPTKVPTQELNIVQVQPTKVPTQELNIVQGQPTLAIVTPMQFAPTSTPQLQIAINCHKSPASQLQVGMKARTVNPGGGTLAMRINLSDPYPTHQIPAMLDVDILAGPQCREGIRMWQVSTVLNGQTVVGWIAEGYEQSYYILPL